MDAPLLPSFLHNLMGAPCLPLSTWFCKPPVPLVIYTFLTRMNSRGKSPNPPDPLTLVLLRSSSPNPRARLSIAAAAPPPSHLLSRVAAAFPGSPSASSRPAAFPASCRSVRLLPASAADSSASCRPVVHARCSRSPNSTAQHLTRSSSVQFARVKFACEQLQSSEGAAWAPQPCH
ncbi:hypothetical protein BRADI_5g15475v3 [Brachypodium distachyon]|uniref:Uncharacterized protein n=1 Tax=Brachypodium distachyon TaxID=15368 RepID=A0A2K2CHG4_BRADI|nr:hypothetical protein BRADI_5g15475v3 [Brachypodium distachyon]